MTVATKILMGSGAVDDSYKIEQSLIMEGSRAIYRTPGTSGNRRTWTLSVWTKRNKLGAWSNIVGGQRNSPASYVYFNPDNQIAVNSYQVGVPTNFYVETTKVLRDVSAWYHIVVNFDTTHSNAANRIRVWVNGVEETSFDVVISPALNFQADFNLAGIPQYVGADYSSVNRTNGQLAEMHWLDGATKVPSDFGETNEDTGQWIPKEYEGGSYGTNGFYLKFASGAIGTDSSGQGNTQTIANIANSDVVPDSPTNNFATINSLVPTSSTFSEGNLKATMGNGGNGKFVSTIGASSGKYYMEIPWLGVANFGVGIAKSNAEQTFLGSAGDDVQFFLASSSTSLYKNGGNNSWAGSGTGWSNNDMVGLALDATNQTIAVYKNGSSIGSYDYSSLGYQQTCFGGGHSINGMIYLPNFGQNPTHSGTVTAGSATDGKGIGLFKNAPPSGYLALCTANLPAPAIALPSADFKTVLWNGNDTNNRTIPVGFAPDLTWFKQRTGTNSLALFDTVRGNSNPNGLSSNSNSVAFDWTGIFKGHTSNGFIVDSGTASNASSNTYVSWNWKAGTVFSNDASVTGIGTNDSNGEVNATAGFSVVEYTGTGSDMTFAHGLSTTPDLIIFKNRTSTANWFVYHSAIDANPNNYFINLNLTAARTNSGWIVVSSTTTRVFGFPNTNNNEYIAYHFVSIPGYSKFGQYIGNGNTNGPFVHCGFKPAFVIRKKVQGVGAWWINDIGRTPNNVSKTVLRANQSDAEVTSGDDSYSIDILSNGFKVRGVYGETNLNNNPFIYIAFAESPFRTSNAH